MSILVLYVFTLFVSFLSILMVGWKYKLNAKSQFIQYAFGVVMYLFFILSLNFMVAGNRILGLEEDFGYHSLICMVLFMGAIFLPSQRMTRMPTIRLNLSLRNVN